MVGHRIKPNSYGFHENLEANIEKIDGHVFLDPSALLTFGNKIMSPNLGGISLAVQHEDR
jgi:hypothetical protein